MFGHLRSGFSCFCGDLLYTCSISIALVIHSFDPALGLKKTGVGIAQERNRVFKRILNSTLYKSTTVRLYGNPYNTKFVGGDQASG